MSKQDFSYTTTGAVNKELTVNAAQDITQITHEMITEVMLNDESVIVAIHRKGKDVTVDRILVNTDAEQQKTANVSTTKLLDVEGFEYAAEDLFMRLNESIYPDHHCVNYEHTLSIGNTIGGGYTYTLNEAVSKRQTISFDVTTRVVQEVEPCADLTLDEIVKGLESGQLVTTIHWSDTGGEQPCIVDITDLCKPVAYVYSNETDPGVDSCYNNFEASYEDR